MPPPFTHHGAGANLDDIAKRASVGAGILFRHFTTRNALIEAVYRSEVENLVAAAPGFAASLSPVEALCAWVLLFVDYVAAKHIISPALNSVTGGPIRLYEGYHIFFPQLLRRRSYLADRTERNPLVADRMADVCLRKEHRMFEFNVLPKFRARTHLWRDPHVEMKGMEDLWASGSAFAELHAIRFQQEIRIINQKTLDKFRICCLYRGQAFLHA